MLLTIFTALWCRYEKMAEQEELNYQQQRRRLFAEVAQEKEKMAEQFQRQKTNSDLQLREKAELQERSGTAWCGILCVHIWMVRVCCMHTVGGAVASDQEWR